MAARPTLLSPVLESEDSPTFDKVAPHKISTPVRPPPLRHASFSSNGSPARRLPFRSPNGKLESPERVDATAWNSIPNMSRSSAGHHASRSMDFAGSLEPENQENHPGGVPVFGASRRYSQSVQRPRAATTHLMNTITRVNSYNEEAEELLRAAFDRHDTGRANIEAYEEAKIGPGWSDASDCVTAGDIWGTAGSSMSTSLTPRYQSLAPKRVAPESPGAVSSNATNSSVGYSTPLSNCIGHASIAPFVPAEAAAHAPAPVQPLQPFSEEHKRRAKEMADYIKSGALAADRPRSATAYRRPQTSQGFRSEPSTTPSSMRSVSPLTPVLTSDPFMVWVRTKGGLTLPEIEKNMPFIEATNFVTTCLSPGVVKVSQIPYSATRNEIAAVFGRNPGFLRHPINAPYDSANHDSIRIMIERQTGKTLDAFVEFPDVAAAQACLSRLQKSPNGHYSARVGQRHTTIELVSASEMMRILFPRAKCVVWEGCEPVVQAPNTDGYISTGFQGFFTSEEALSMTKLAKDPKRSRFNRDHPQRIFENMIDILCKYPWHRPELYTVGERDRVFKSTLDLMDVLCNTHLRYSEDGNLCIQLLEELASVAQFCPGFNDKQRALLVDLTHHRLGAPPWPLTVHAHSMPFACLVKHPFASDEYMEYIAGLLSHSAAKAGDASKSKPRGVFNGFQVVYNCSTSLASQKVSEAACAEWGSVMYALRYALTTFE